MKLALTGGTTSVTLLVFIQDTTSATGAGLTGLVFNTASLTAYYARPGAAAAAITLATQTVAGAFSSGGFVEVDATNMPGVYRFDIPDAALAAGVSSVVAMLKGAANMAPLLLEIQLSPMPANVTQIDAAATSGNNATLNLKQLNIVNNAGSALVASSTGSDGHGIEASGNGGGEGIKATGGATGSGIEAVGGATSGHGVSGVATASNSDGMRLSGVGAGSGLQTIGGATGHGIQAIGGQTSGNGIRARVNAAGASNDNGMSIEGNGSGNGLYVVGGATGHGFQATGGATSGNAINAAAAAGNGHGLSLAGQGSGHGLIATGGATGNGIDANGGATSGDGINAAAPTLGDGMQLTGAGAGGLDLDAAINEFTAAGLAQFFLTDSGETYASSVAGSVVQEITVNSGGAGITAQGVRDAMKLAPTAGAAAAGSVDVKLDDILDDTGTSGVVISTTTQNSIADALLKRDWTAVTGEAARSALNALRAIRNRVRINAGTLTVYEEDDATPAWTAPVTTDAAALPITEIDPT